MMIAFPSSWPTNATSNLTLWNSWMLVEALYTALMEKYHIQISSINSSICYLFSQNPWKQKQKKNHLYNCLYRLKSCTPFAKILVNCVELGNVMFISYQYDNICQNNYFSLEYSGRSEEGLDDYLHVIPMFFGKKCIIILQYYSFDILVW